MLLSFTDFHALLAGEFFEICILMMAGEKVRKTCDVLSFLIWIEEETLYIFRSLV